LDLKYNIICALRLKEKNNIVDILPIKFSNNLIVFIGSFIGKPFGRVIADKEYSNPFIHNFALYNLFDLSIFMQTIFQLLNMNLLEILI
jgi:hypothetical protein